MARWRWSCTLGWFMCNFDLQLTNTKKGSTRVHQTEMGPLKQSTIYIEVERDDNQKKVLFNCHIQQLHLQFVGLAE